LPAEVESGSRVAYTDYGSKRDRDGKKERVNLQCLLKPNPI